MLTVKRLKELIADLDDNLPVAVDGYEYGIGRIEECGVKVEALTTEKMKYSSTLNKYVYLNEAEIIEVLYISRFNLMTNAEHNGYSSFIDEDKSIYGGTLEAKED